MTRRRRTTKEIELIKLQLSDLLEDEFEKNGQVVTHRRLAERHVLRNMSTSAEQDVALYGGVAVAHLRREKGYAIVPITAAFDEWRENSEDEEAIINAVAGLGAGGSRIGWYQPVERDDWLWIYYIGHLLRSGIKAVYHGGGQVDNNKQLNTPQTRRYIAIRAISKEAPPGATEVKVLTERITKSTDGR